MTRAAPQSPSRWPPTLAAGECLGRGPNGARVGCRAGAQSGPTSILWAGQGWCALPAEDDQTHTSYCLHCCRLRTDLDAELRVLDASQAQLAVADPVDGMTLSFSVCHTPCAQLRACGFLTPCGVVWRSCAAAYVLFGDPHAPSRLTAIPPLSPHDAHR